jgi:prepilin-type N-terminal cleavage/methylation domain-containing protein
MNLRGIRGFSLMELLICVSIVSILAGVAVVQVGDLTGLAREQVARSRAEILDAARRGFALARPDAGELWAREDEAGRQSLLAAHGLHTADTAYLSSPGGYRLYLDGALREPTRIERKGRVIPR